MLSFVKNSTINLHCLFVSYDRVSDSSADFQFKTSNSIAFGVSSTKISNFDECLIDITDNRLTKVQFIPTGKFRTIADFELKLIAG